MLYNMTLFTCLKGTLKGFDQTINLILDESHERVFSSSQGVEQVVLGLYIVRGDNVYVLSHYSSSGFQSLRCEECLVLVCGI